MPQLMEICHLLHEENGWLDLSESKVHDVLSMHYQRTGGIIGVIGPPENLQGAIVLHLTTMWYSDKYYLEELCSFVKPEFRRSDNAKKLIDFATKCAVDIGVPLLIGIVSNERTEAKIGLYRRKLGKPAGAYFVANDVIRAAASEESVS
jgi:GNAT superfamily N-acetyltransferase